MSMHDVVVPDVGDSRDVEVAELLVKVGDEVKEGDALIVLESDKASMEVPSTAAGKIAALSVSAGDKVEQGQLLVRIESIAASATPAPAAVASPNKSTAPTSIARAASPSTPTVVPAPASAAAPVSQDVVVPDIGDAKNVVVSELLVKEGDPVTSGQPLVVLESDKASMEIEAPAAGVITRIAVTAGQEVNQGVLVLVLGGLAAASVTAVTTAPAAVNVAKPSASKPTPALSRAVEAQVTQAGNNAKVYAGPAVRRMARELGVDLAAVKPTGTGGRVVKQDVQAHVKARLTEAPMAAVSREVEGGGGIPPIPTVDFSRFGAVTEEKLSRIMRAGGVNLHRSWLNLPHVTHNDEADITDLEVFRKSLKDEAQKAGVRLTPLAFLVKACTKALQDFPRFNSSLHANKESLWLKQYYNVGVAVDTPEGLVVPVVKDTDKKGLYQLARDIADLSERARTKKLKPDEMQGGTFSISSLGVLGGTSFTPIINAPEVAILGVAKLATKPVWNGSTFVPREMLPLSLSYDHRVINGADAARFTSHLIALLGDMRRLLL